METQTEPETSKQEEDRDALLDLDTLVPTRQLVKIDGTAYELRVMSDFGIADQQELTHNGREYDRLWNKGSLSKAEKAKLKLLLDKMTERVLDAPSKVIAKLSDAQRSNIVLAFTLAPLVTASETAPETTAPTTESESITES